MAEPFYYRVPRDGPTANLSLVRAGSANLPISLGKKKKNAFPRTRCRFLAVTGNVATIQFNRGAFSRIVPALSRPLFPFDGGGS